jgi:adenylate cyclase
MSKAIRPIVAGLLVGMCGAAIVLALDWVFSHVRSGTAVNPLQTLEMQTYDWRLTRTARPETARKDILLVEIDEYSLRNMEQFAGRWPWPRLFHATLLDFLSRGHPKVIAYDVNFAGPDPTKQFELAGTNWSGAESDKELAKSARKAGNVIMLADATYEVDKTAYAALQAKSAFPPDDGYPLDVPGVIEREQIFPPYDGLRDAVSGFGHNLAILDSDGPMRHTVPFVRSNHRALPSLGVASALKAGGIKADEIRLDGSVLRFGNRAVMPLSERRVMSQDGVSAYKWEALNFRGPAFLEDGLTRPYTSYHFWDLWKSENQILGEVKPDVDPSVFKDKIVFVGVNATSLFDAFETPFSGGTTGFRMPGAQIHATIADDILSNRFIWPASTGARVATVVGAALIVGLVSALLPAWWATGATALFVVALGGASFWMFAGGYWMNLSQPVLASTLSLFGGVGYQYFIEGREKRKMKKLFGQYVSKDVYDHLVSNPELARLGGARREMTVLFSDIRGFTSVSERGQPEEIVRTLNEYFTRMVELVFKHGGTLDKFVGDMVMALFGAPLDDPDHADHAVEAALDMIGELRTLNEGWTGEGRPELDIGIGINTGPMIAGNIGSDLIMSYTVIGDAVNLGSRLESLNKQYGTRIIISESTKNQLKKKYVLRPLGDVVVKGKTKPVAIFELIGREGEAPVGIPLTTAHRKDSPVTEGSNVTKEAHA